VQKSPLPSDNHVTALTVETVEQINQITAVMAKDAWEMPQQKALTVDGWRLESPEILDLLEKLRISGIPLSKYVQERIFRGVVTGFNKAFIIDSITREQLIAEQPSSEEIIKRYLRGKDIKRWYIDYQDLWIIFSRRGINIKNYPAIYNYLLQFKKRLIPGVKGGRKPGTYKWYEIQDNIAYWREFEQTKIVWGNLAIRPKFAFADAGYYINAPANIIVSDSKYLLGILNSSVTQFLVYKSAAERAGGFLEFKPIYIAPLAIPPQPRDENISEVVARILDKKQINPTADISALEEELDYLVYALYDLAEEEIALVEESAGR